jgi:hypothetical protein
MKNTTRWALERAAQGLLVDSPPTVLWVFEPGLRKISHRAKRTASITLSRQMLSHLGVEMNDLVMVLPRTDGVLVIRKATAKDLRQANPYTKLTAIPGRKGKKATS